MERKKSLPSQNVVKTILFVSDIDRTLIYHNALQEKAMCALNGQKTEKNLAMLIQTILKI